AQLARPAAALAGPDRRPRLGSVAVAVLAAADDVVGDLAAGADGDVGQLDLDLDQDVAARRRLAAAEPDPAAEEGLEDVIDRAEAGPRLESARAQPVVPVGVVGAPPLGVGEDLVGRRGLLELLLR